MELILHNVTKAFPDKTVVDNVSYTFSTGKRYLFIGHNGAGKSMLIKMIGQDIHKSSGEITVTEGLSLKENVIIQQQDFQCFPHLKVKEVIKLVSTLNDTLPLDTELYSILELDKIANTLIRKLSGGEKKALHIFLAMYLKNPIKIFDEPFAALDFDKKERLYKYFKNKKDIDIIYIFVSHEVQNIADLFDEIIFMDHGKIIEAGTIEALQEKYKNGKYPGIEGMYFIMTGKILGGAE